MFDAQTTETLSTCNNYSPPRRGMVIISAPFLIIDASSQYKAEYGTDSIRLQLYWEYDGWIVSVYYNSFL